MKKIFFLFIAAAGTVFTMGCGKENMNALNKNEDTQNTLIASAIAVKGAEVEEVVTVNIPMNTVFKRDLGVFGREEYAEIIKPPVHAAISSLDRNGSNIVYTYMPEKNFTGTDEVTIQLNKDSDGAGNYSTTFLKIVINVGAPQ